MPDQKAKRILQIQRDEVFILVGPPWMLHSDQGRNFESKILAGFLESRNLIPLLIILGVTEDEPSYSAPCGERQSIGGVFAIPTIYVKDH